MLIVSWNVAGWLTSLNHIREKHGSLEEWMVAHSIDILALQEIKVQPTVLRDHPRKVAADIEGFDTFWSPCRLKGAGQHLNGVATFARKGLTVGAESCPFRDEAFDEEGRCIMTEHETFVIFNVYVPNDSTGGKRLPYKLRFLDALKSRMDAARRDTGKAIFLIGDMNMCRRPQDMDWGSRMVNVEAFLRDIKGSGKGGWEEGTTVDKLGRELSGWWGEMRRRLMQRQVKPVTRTQGSKPVTKFRVFVEGLDGKPAPVTGSFETEEEAMGKENDNYCTDGRMVEGYVARREGELRVSELWELAKVCMGATWTEEEVRALADMVGSSKTSPPCLKWFEEVLEGGMVDSFTEFWPLAEARFTCWDQYKNKRYTNQGARIDYILVDDSWFRKHAVRGASQLYGEEEHEVEKDHRAHRDDAAGGGAGGQAAEAGGGLAGALRACTSYGRWRMAGYDGSGLQEGSQKDYDAQFFRPHTGIVYTPPKYSDHVGVSLLVNIDASSASAVLRGDEATRRAMPHAQQRKIASFFRAAPAPESPATGTPPSGSGTPQGVVQSAKKGGMAAWLEGGGARPQGVAGGHRVGGDSEGGAAKRDGDPLMREAKSSRTEEAASAAQSTQKGGGGGGAGKTAKSGSKAGSASKGTSHGSKKGGNKGVGGGLSSPGIAQFFSAADSGGRGEAARDD